MTTEASAADRAARLEALRQRRATSAGSSARPTTAAPGTPARHRHAATGARILAAGLSAATTVALVGAMAGAAPGGAPSPPSPGATQVPAPEPTVLIGDPSDLTAPGSGVAAAPPVSRAVAAPVTASHGS